jgi:hypothetical protein
MSLEEFHTMEQDKFGSAAKNITSTKRSDEHESNLNTDEFYFNGDNNDFYFSDEDDVKNSS